MPVIREYNSIYHLKGTWTRLYEKSDTKSCFLQAFTPNKVYFNAFKFDRHRFLLQPRFIYASDDESEIIFPITVDKTHKRITEFAPLDYFDIISYRATPELVSAILSWLKLRYPRYDFIFSRVSQDSILLRMKELFPTELAECVSISFKFDSIDEYIASLSKHQRQNIRTAYNRLEREHIRIAIKRYDNDRFFPSGLKRACSDIYYRRSADKSPTSSVFRQFYNRISKPVLQIMKKADNGVFYVLFLNDEPAAFMAGGFTKDNDCYTVPVFSSSNKHLRYSPGIVMICELAELFISERVSILDLAKGSEPYKYAMGGRSHYNYSVSLKG